ncbi:MAG TPA: sulfatase-like hydrolase/transferase [Mycobacteriales bacterium]|nr:sulfatase-like hydrolase/transferase [Mycobacteriales bacterium]
MASRDPDRPNVVFVVTDDQGPWALGCAGNDEIHTPNLDALATGGLRLSRFFCASPVCSPARATLYTGQIPSRHGVHDWLAGGQVGPDRIDFLAGRTLLTDVLSTAGYRCGLVGKWHLGANDRSRPGFVHWFAHQFGGGPYFDAPVVRDGRLETQPGYLTYALSDGACDFVEAEADREEPFFLALHYTAPHSPWTGNHPPELTDLYADCAFATCPQGERHPWTPVMEGRPVGGEPDDRAALTGYFAAVTGVDLGVGKLLSTLDRLDLQESTLIVFTSDNGFNCGHHGIWGKGNGTYPQNMYDSSVMVPAIISQPGRIPGGRVSDSLLSAYDVFPTVLDHVGVAAEPPGPGRSFAPLLCGAEIAERDRVVVFDEYGPVRMIRTRDWKYVRRWPSGPDELYDLRNDPGETRNLVAEPSHAGRVADLRAELDGWFAQYADPAHDGRFLEVGGRGQVTRDDQPHAFRFYDGILGSTGE